MSWKGILGKAGVSLTGPNGANDWTFEGAVHARNIISRFAGQHFHVDSGSSAASDSAKYGKRKEKPFATIDYAVGQCTINDGDVIWVHAGHTEAIIAVGGLALDVEGITIVFLGNGDDQAKITFGTDVDADMDVDADNITLINPRFESVVDALTGPIDINKSNFTIINGEYYDAAGKAAIDCVVAVPAAKGLIIDGWKYFESTTGTQKESNFQLNGVDDLTLRNIDIRGDFATGNIENVTDELLNVRFKDIYLDNLNASPTPSMVLDSNCDGFAENVNVRIASGTTYLSDDSDINWGPNCRGYAADGGSGEPLGTSSAGDIEAKIDVIDGYHDVPVKDVATDTLMRDVVGRKTDSAAAGAVSEEESVMAYAKQAVTEGIARDAVIGAVDTAAATGAVTNADLIMGYAKQLVTEGIARDGVIGALNTAEAAGAVTNADLMMAYVKQLVTAAITEAAQSLKLDGVTLATAPVANSLAAYIASGGTVLGQELPDSQSLIDLLGDFTGPHNGADQDDNLKTSLDLAHTDLDAIIQQVAKTTALKNVVSVTTANLFTVAGGAVQLLGITGHIKTGLEAAANNTKLVHTSTGGAAVDLCGVLDVTGSAIRKLLTITGTKANAMTLSADEGVVVDNLTAPLILTPGILSLNCAATTTGDIDWYVVYKPLASGATIVAA